MEASIRWGDGLSGKKTARRALLPEIIGCRR